MSYTQHQRRQKKAPKTNYKGLMIWFAVAFAMLGLISPKLAGMVLLFPFVMAAAVVIGGGMALMFGGADIFMAIFGRIFRDR